MQHLHILAQLCFCIYKFFVASNVPMGECQMRADIQHLAGEVTKFFSPFYTQFTFWVQPIKLLFRTLVSTSNMSDDWTFSSHLSQTLHISKMFPKTGTKSQGRFHPSFLYRRGRWEIKGQDKRKNCTGFCGDKHSRLEAGLFLRKQVQQGDSHWSLQWLKAEANKA